LSLEHNFEWFSLGDRPGVFLVGAKVLPLCSFGNTFFTIWPIPTRV
jgi:hypothetical protein